MMFAALRASITYTHMGNVGRRRRAGFYNRFAELNSSNDLEDAKLPSLEYRSHTHMHTYFSTLADETIFRERKREGGNDGGVSLYNILIRRDCILNMYVDIGSFSWRFRDARIASKSKRRLFDFLLSPSSSRPY